MEDTGRSTTCSSTVNRTAVIRLHSLGDVVLAQPAAARLAEDGEVIFISSMEYIPVVSRMKGGIRPAGFDRELGFRGLRRLVGEASPNRIVDLQNSLTTRLACAGKRVCGRFVMQRKLRRAVIRGRHPSMPSRRTDFLRAAGFEAGPSASLERRLEKPDNLRAGIIAGGRWRLKSLPVSVVSEAARILVDTYGAEVLVAGAPEDRADVEMAAEEARRHGVSTFCGETGLEGLMNALEGLSVLISPDSGPAHLADALGVPVLTVFTSTSPALGFWDPRRSGNYTASEMECRPCHRHGGLRCRRGDEICRRGIVPLELVRRAMELARR